MAIFRRKKKMSAKKLKRIKTVFGSDVQFDENGKPIEQGIGAPGHETLSHYAALAKTLRIEAKYDPTDENKAAAHAAQQNYKKMQLEFAEQDDDDEEDEEDLELEEIE